MSFREKVKELLEGRKDSARTARLRTTPAEQACIDAASKKSKKKLEKEDEKAKAERKESRKFDIFEPVEKKSKPKKTTVTIPKGTIKVDGKTHISPHAIARKAARVAADKEREKVAQRKRRANTARVRRNLAKRQVDQELKSKNENSNHPFYQKVKALSRGKKNNSLLEKKSNSIKTFKILLGRKKSKMDEAKKMSKEEIEIERKERMQKYGTEQPAHLNLEPLPPLPRRKKRPEKHEPDINKLGRDMGWWD